MSSFWGIKYRSNSEPWLKVQPGTHQKYGYVNQKFEKRYSRE